MKMVLCCAVVECGRKERWLWPRDLRDSGSGSGYSESVIPAASSNSSATPELTQSLDTSTSSFTVPATSTLHSTTANYSAMTAVTTRSTSATSSIQIPEATSTLFITATPVSSSMSEQPATSYLGVKARSFQVATSFVKTSTSMEVALSSSPMKPKLTSHVLVSPYSGTSTTFSLSATPQVSMISRQQRPTQSPSLPLSTSLPSTTPGSVTKLTQLPVKTLTSQLSQTTVTSPPPPPPRSPSHFFTSTLFLATAGGGTGALLLCLISLVSTLVACRKRIKRKCPCCRTTHKIRGPIITVSYRGSNRGGRESYFIKTNDLRPSSAFYTRRGEDDASKEFTTTFFTTPSFSGPSSIPPAHPANFHVGPVTNAAGPVTYFVDSVARDHQQREVRSVKFKSLERTWKPSPQHLV